MVLTRIDIPLHGFTENVSRRTKRVSAVTTIAFLLYLVTGGLVLSEYHVFRDKSGKTSDEGLVSGIEIEADYTQSGIPFLFIYRSTVRRYDLHVRLLEEAGSPEAYRFVSLNEIVLQYSDGTTVCRSVSWSRGSAKPDSTEIRAKTPFRYTEPAAIDRHTEVTVTVRGEATAEAGHVVPFSAKRTFEAHVRGDLTTFWAHLEGA